MIRALLLLTVISCVFNKVSAQTEWVMKGGKSPDYILSTEITHSTIMGYTRKNALVAYLGEATFRMIKSKSALKHAEIIRFSGTFDTASRIFSGTLHNLFSEKKITGHLSDDSISLTIFTTGSSETEVVKGSKKRETVKTRDYTSVVKEIIRLTEENLYDPRFLQGKTWSSFKEVMLANAAKIADDLELQIGILSLARNFPFTHYSLARTTANQTYNNFSVTAPTPETCLLTISSFSGTSREMDSIIDIIDRGQYKHLIIDLRNNGGGDNETAAPLLSYILDKETILGIFPNKRWYLENEKPPSEQDYKNFSSFSSGTLADFYTQSEQGYGSFLLSIPSKKHFPGKVFVITNKSTASTSEIAVLALKENKLATIVGQATMGAALSGKKFILDEQVSIFIPQNDYISFNGYRIDKRGIKPDFTIKDEDEVQYILNHLIGK